MREAQEHGRLCVDGGRPSTGSVPTGRPASAERRMSSRPRAPGKEWRGSEGGGNQGLIEGRANEKAKTRASGTEWSFDGGDGEGR
jgi:hypothetical protein